MKTTVEVNLEVIDNADGTLNCLNSNRTAVLPSMAHYRGQSSLHFSKHQLAVKLHEASNFLGFPADTRFVLNGPAIDTSLLRNHLAHWLYRGTTRYSPRSRHIVVFIRDRLENLEPAYKGIYVALEKISYGPSRVGLAPLDTACRDAELSGGWAWQNNPLNYGVYSPNIVIDKYQMLFGSGERPILMAPKPAKLTQRMRDFFVDPRTGPLPRMYEYLYDNLSDPSGLEAHIDIGSFVDYFLHSEMSQNSDAYRRSTYFFKDRGQPINAGPVWDFNLAYGKGANQLDWLYKPHSFWKRLTCHYKFASLVPKRWRELRAGVWSDEAITEFLGNASALIGRQLERCSSNWTSGNLQCANVRGDGTFIANVDQLGRTTIARAHWMDEHVARFYMKLNATVCMPAGPIPQYNCAADGNDGGCLSDPEKYINAVEFPAVRRGSEASECAGVAAAAAAAAASNVSSDEAAEKVTLDPCWLSAGVYVNDGSLTPFCSGYGACPPGPGASCTCTSGRKLPTCARSDDPIEVRSFVQSGDAPGSWRVLCGAAIVGAALVVGGLAVGIRRRRERKRQALLYPPIVDNTRAASSPLQYGT
ncbi:hypothetical protein PybrP1_001559 [[Pythium] brassicae (nom. inval.)]|nr:hypothetical protein PybrP1_001559 [[Pythium] brassicae (nom. inval.)]